MPLYFALFAPGVPPREARLLSPEKGLSVRPTHRLRFASHNDRVADWNYNMSLPLCSVYEHVFTYWLRKPVRWLWWRCCWRCQGTRDSKPVTMKWYVTIFSFFHFNQIVTNFLLATFRKFVQFVNFLWLNTVLWTISGMFKTCQKWRLNR